MKSQILLILLFFYQIASATNTVDIKIINLTSDTVKCLINVSENIESNSNLLFTIEILPGKDTLIVKEVDKNSLLSGYGLFKKGGRSEKQYHFVVKSRDMFSLAINIPSDVNNKSLTQLQGGQILDYDPSKFLDSDFTPKPIEGLFSQYLGGLVAYVDSNNKMMVKTTIPPAELGTEMKIKYGEGTSSKEINFINQNADNIKGSIPAIAQLGVSWDNSSFYNVKIEYNKIGVIDYSSTGEQLANSFMRLSELEKYNLGFLKARYPFLKLKQINQAYVFEAVYLEVNQGEGLGISSDLSALSVLTNKGNFKISKNTLDKKVFGNSYLGYWCNSTARDLTGLLDYPLAVYQSVAASSFSLKADSDVVNEYNSIRESNPILPRLKTKDQIINFYKSEVERFKSLNPQKKSDALLQPLKTNIINSIDNMSVEDINVELNKLGLRNYTTIPYLQLGSTAGGLDLNTAKILVGYSRQGVKL